MGDRSNIAFEYNDEFPMFGRVKRADMKVARIYFYAHWLGPSSGVAVLRALKNVPGRWKDEAYLARQVFGQMIEDDPTGETGFGIAPYRISDEYALIVINAQKQQVWVEQPEGKVKKRWSFKEFSEFSEEQAVMVAHLGMA